MTLDEWRPVVGYEGRYEVSDQGRVRSLDVEVTDCIGRTRSYKGRVLSPAVERQFPAAPYFKVQLYGRLDAGRAESFRVHVLVAAAFIGPRPPGLEVAHNDGDPQNNVPSNLRYATHADNNADRIRHGTHLRPRCVNGHARTVDNLTARHECLTCVIAREARSRVKKREKKRRMRALQGGQP